MNIRFKRSSFTASTLIVAAIASLSSCGENPYAPPPIAKRVGITAPANDAAPSLQADDVADLKECAGAVQALLGFDPIVQSDRDHPQWLPVYYDFLGLLEKAGVEFSQRIEATRANAAIWQGRPTTELEARVRVCQSRHLG